MTASASTILIYSDQCTQRLTYVLDFVFKEKGQSYTLISDVKKLNDQKVAIAYSHQTINSSLQIAPAGLLEETKINHNWSVDFDKHNNDWLINGKEDSLSIIFFFLSRYEEYIDQTKDSYNRYTAQQSIFFKHNQLHIPWCDILVKKIWLSLGLSETRLKDHFKVLLSYDIDIAWAHKYKPFWRTIVGSIQYLLKPKQLRERYRVIAGRSKDPYDNYDLIYRNTNLHPSILFFLLGDYGALDKNHHWKNKKLQQLIRSSSKTSKCGIHPSFGSFLNQEQVKKECLRLESIMGSPIKDSRQHFLRMTLPESYILLESIGVSHDYTMGYAEHYGFRAGTSFPYHFFNLKDNKKGLLTIVPFSFMDGTLKEYMSLTPADAILVIEDLKHTIQSVGGQFVPIWHNHSIGNTNEWKGWQQVYNACLKLD